MVHTLKAYINSNGIVFIIGFLVSCLVIASVFLVNKEEKDKYKDSDQANEMDYDGMGNYGRFPQKN